MRTVTTTTGGLVYEELLRLPGETLISVWPCGVVRTEAGNLIDISSQQTIGLVQGTRVAIVATNSGWLVAEEQTNSWQFSFLQRGKPVVRLSLTLPVQNVIRSGERLFATTEAELVELQLQAFSTPVLTTGSRWQILGNSTHWFSGFGISDVLGAQHLVVPNGDAGVAIIRTAQLDGKRIINGVAGGRTASVITVDKSGQYEIYDFVSDKDWQTYAVQVRSVDGPGINQVVLPKGVTAEIREDGEIQITVPTSGIQKVVRDKDLLTTMRLSNIGDQVVYRHDGALWSLRMN